MRKNKRFVFHYGRKSCNDNIHKKINYTQMKKLKLKTESWKNTELNHFRRQVKFPFLIVITKHCYLRFTIRSFLRFISLKLTFNIVNKQQPQRDSPLLSFMHFFNSQNTLNSNTRNMLRRDTFRELLVKKFEFAESLTVEEQINICWMNCLTSRYSKCYSNKNHTERHSNLSWYYRLENR